jgi:hypothetical protein
VSVAAEKNANGLRIHPASGHRRPRRDNPARLGPAQQPTYRSPRMTSPRSGTRTRRSLAPRSTPAGDPADAEHQGRRPTPPPATRSPPITGLEVGDERVGQMGGRASGQRHRRLVADHAGRGRCHRGYGLSRSGRVGQHPHPPTRPPVPAPSGSDPASAQITAISTTLPTPWGGTSSRAPEAPWCTSGGVLISLAATWSRGECLPWCRDA